MLMESGMSPFWFTEGILEQNQTFVIDKAGYDRLYEKDRDFAELIDFGKFIYLGYVVCINDTKYVTVEITGNKAELKLTDYAREHADECCLVFSFRSTSYLKGIQDKYEFYGESYLSKEVKSDNYVEHYYDKHFNNSITQTASEVREQVAIYLASAQKVKDVNLELMQKGCDNFADMLLYHMDRKGIKIDELVERADLSDTTIKNYRSGDVPNPPIENVMAICIGLNLSKEYCLEMLRVAGYTLNDSLKHIAYKYLLDYTDGTIIQWNMILDAFGQPHIPYKRNQKTT